MENYTMKPISILIDNVLEILVISCIINEIASFGGEDEIFSLVA